MPVRVPVRLPAALLAGLLFLALPATPATAPEEPVIASGVQRERVDLILVDVIVTDRKGRRIEDLRPDEFTLRVDGNPHPIESIELQRILLPALPDREAAGAKGPLPAPRPEEASGEQVAPSPLVRSFVRFFDGLNAERGVGQRALDASREFLRRGIQPGEEVMVVGQGRQFKIYQQFTSDPALLLEAVDAVETDPGIRESGEDRTSSDFDRIGEIKNFERGWSNPGAACPNCYEPLATEFARSTRVRIRRTLTSLSVLVAFLDPRPGRKEVLLLSDGFPSDPAAFYEAPHELSLEHEILRLAREAASAQVAISTVNTQGVPAPGDAVQNARERAGTRTLATFALNTGGLAFHSTNKFAAALLRVEEEGRSPYLLAFRPSGEPDDGLHSVRVEVSRKGTRVRASEGFVWMTPERLTEREVLSAFLSPELFSTLSISLETISYLEEGGVPALELAVALADESLLFLPRKDSLIARLEAGWVLLAGRSVVVDRYSRAVEIRLTPEEFARRGDITLLARRSVPPGIYEAVAVVRDLETGNIGAVRGEVKVPALSTDRMAVSSIVLSSPAERIRGVEMDPSAPVASRIGVPSVRRIFTRSSIVEASCLVYHPVPDAATGQTRLLLRASIRDRGGTARELTATRRVFKASESGQSIPVSFPLPLEGLEAGVYALEVQVLDEVGGSGVVQRVEFIVR